MIAFLATVLWCEEVEREVRAIHYVMYLDLLLIVIVNVNAPCAIPTHCACSWNALHLDDT